MTISSAIQGSLRDRIQWMAVLIVACFVAVLVMKSQSRASYPTYFLALLMIVFVRQWRDVFQVDLARWIVLFLGWLSLSVLWSNPLELREAVSFWIRALLVFAFVVAFAECQLRGQLHRWMAHALTVVGAGATIVAIINFYATDPADGRLNGMGQLDTHVVAALVYGAVLIFVLRIVSGTYALWAKTLALLIAGVIVMAVALSDSRNAWVSVAMGVVAFILSLKVKDPRQFVITISSSALILLVALLVLAGNDEIREFLLPRGDSFRFVIWQSALERISNAPWFGHGILSSDDFYIDNIRFMHPHNMILAILHHGGIVALLIYAAILGMTTLSLLRHYSELDAKIGLSILTIGLSSQLLDAPALVDKVGASWFLIWLPVAIALGLRWRSQLKPTLDD